jgi:hypothetical protein
MRAFLIALLAAVPAWAQQPPPGTETAYACTEKTLQSGQDCVFEGIVTVAEEPLRGAQMEDNIRRAVALGTEACAGPARKTPLGAPDKDVLAACQKEVTAAAADACALDGKLPLHDGRGRFAAAARGCYEALSQALRRAKMTAEVAAGCCKCLTKNKCAASMDACNREIASGSSSAPASCVDKACREECAGIATAPEAPAPARRASDHGGGVQKL